MESGTEKAAVSIEIRSHSLLEEDALGCKIHHFKYKTPRF